MRLPGIRLVNYFPNHQSILLFLNILIIPAQVSQINNCRKGVAGLGHKRVAWLQNIICSFFQTPHTLGKVHSHVGNLDVKQRLFDIIGVTLVYLFHIASQYFSIKIAEKLFLKYERNDVTV